MAFRARNVFGTFEKRAAGLEAVNHGVANLLLYRELGCVVRLIALKMQNASYAVFTEGKGKKKHHAPPPPPFLKSTYTEKIIQNYGCVN